MGQYPLCQHLAQLNAFLVKAVQVPCEALEHHLVFKVCKQSTQSLGSKLFADDYAGGAAAFKVLVAVLILLAAGKGDYWSWVTGKWPWQNQED